MSPLFAMAVVKNQTAKAQMTSNDTRCLELCGRFTDSVRAEEVME
jgi:hypothetical protein